MNNTRKQQKKVLKAVAVIIAMIIYVAVAYTVSAGPAKTGGTYDINDDALTAAGSTDITGGAYWLVFSAGQPIGHEDMGGGTYSLEGGYVSGVIAVFQVAKTLDAIETPGGYTGNPTDQVPGGRLTYKVEFENFGEGASNVLLEDSIPLNSSFDSGTMILTLNKTAVGKTDASGDDECAYQAATTSIHCLISGVAAGGTGAVTFKAIIN